MKLRQLSLGQAVRLNVALASLLLLAVAMPGCTSRVSPAAQTAVDTGSPDESTSARADVAADTAAEPKADASEIQLATATDAATPPESKPEPAAKAKFAGTRDINFDTIKFEMKKEEPFVRTMLTPAIEQLAGGHIRIRGYILPSFQQTGITQFILVRDNMECCFGPGAALYDCIVVEMTPGQSANFTTRPVAVEGVFDIQEMVGPDDKHLAIYHMVADRVK